MAPDTNSPDSAPVPEAASASRIQKTILGKAQVRVSVFCALHVINYVRRLAINVVSAKWYAPAHLLVDLILVRSDQSDVSYLEMVCAKHFGCHHKMVRVNPHLRRAEPHCTYDEVPGAPWDVENQLSAENLRKLEARVAELEGQLNTGPIQQSSNCIPEGQPFSLSPDFSRETANEIPEFPYSSFPSSMMADEWPSSLPSKPLFLHLVDLFFNCWPNSRRVIHRPTFLSNLLEPPSSPRFPFIGLLHAICAAAALHSPYVSVAPMPDLRTRPTEDIFQEKTRMLDGRALAFDEQHFLLAKHQSMASARIGEHIMEATQACIINAWWSFSAGRWFDVWAMSSLAIRLSNAMGLNFSDDQQKSISERMRHKLLIHEPQSYTDIELRRNVFWCAYALQRYHLFVSPWCFDINDEDINQTLPATLESFEAGTDDGRERQTILSLDLFTAHSDNLDDFGIYIKCAIMLSRVHVLQHRHLQKYSTVEEVRASHEIQAIDAMTSAMK
ncbi:Fungal specific transcription factor domain [Ceratobasidium sp. AG-Ba]|nr:Fungal specific transcription factor domain [Ceratobasidium sp. AG-Ba]